MNQSRRAALGSVLLILGIGLGAVARLAASGEQVSYYGGAAPPRPYAKVTEGRTYELSVHGGVAALSAKGLAAASVDCGYSVEGEATRRALTVTAETADTKAVNTFATFTAPITARISVDCTGWGPVYIDDADDAPADLSGWYLVGCVIALTLGAGLALSALRSAGRRPHMVEAAEPAQ